MAPEAARVGEADACPAAVREQPHLRGHRVEAVPRVDAQDSQPELSPRGNVLGAAARVDPGPGALGRRVLRRHPEETHGDVVEAGPEHGRVALDVEAVAAVAVLVVDEVPRDLLLVLRGQHLVHAAGGVAGDHQPGHEEHWAAVVARPVPVVPLQVPVKVHPGPESVGGAVLGDRALLW